jgi:Uma2 family endonuclease
MPTKERGELAAKRTMENETGSRTVSTAILVSLDEYLHTLYRPDCDYINGRLDERNVGMWDHGRLQTALAMYLNANVERFHVIAATEIRVQVGPEHYQVAEVCCVDENQEPDDDGIVTAPPALVIEILSPDDTVPKTEDRIENYLLMGVPFVWLLFVWLLKEKRWSFLMPVVN